MIYAGKDDIKKEQLSSRLFDLKDNRERNE